MQSSAIIVADAATPVNPAPGAFHTIAAVEKVTVRTRPVTQMPAPTVEEVLTTHAARCPLCQREVRVKPGNEAVVYGGCLHFAGIERSGNEVSVFFEERR